MTAAKKPKQSSKTPNVQRTSDDSEYLKLENQVCFPLYAAARMMVNAYRPLLGELGLTYPQYLVLLVLWETDGLSVTAIGEQLHLDSGTLTPLLKRLATLGLIERRRNPDDDRIVGNWLTPMGMELKRRAMHVPVQLLCNAKLDIGELEPMRRVFRRLIDALLPLQEPDSTAPARSVSSAGL
ncbi:MAG TPA: MarR family transcriptional regulator [Labilithrix sp.]|jgi:DNA-binding MarR family transcriptional regulator|nr:MarR family transcriptional regulator [Labilithrix sp.]